MYRVESWSVIRAVHVDSTDWNRYRTGASCSWTFYKTRRRDFVVPPRGSVAAAATATPDDDNDSGRGLTGMVAVLMLTHYCHR